MSAEEELRQTFKQIETDATPNLWPAVVGSIRPRRSPLWHPAIRLGVAAVVVFGIALGARRLVGDDLATQGATEGPLSPSASQPASPSDTGLASSLEPGATVIALPTTPPGTLGGDALATGTLDGDLRSGKLCLWISSAPNQAAALVWPSGFTGRDHPLGVVGPDGQDIAQIGDSVALGGMGAPPGYVPTKAQDPCDTGHIFVVSIVGSVNGNRLDIGEGSLRLVTRQSGTPITCPATFLEPLLLVMTNGSLHLRQFGIGADFEVTWPNGFVAKSGGRITVVDPAGRVVMTQGSDVMNARGVERGRTIDVCGFGERTYS
jgi:hypothetical protein